MSEKFMRGPVHLLAILLGVGLPSGLTMSTLRTGADYEVAATPRQVVERLQAGLAGGDRAALNRLVAADVVTHRSADLPGSDAFVAAASADAARTRDLAERKVSATANVVMVESSRKGADGSVAPVVQIYRVYGGRIVEYWSAQPQG